MRESMLYSPLGILIAVCLLTGLGVASAGTCERNTFWSSFFNKCMNCTKCVHPDIVITPCQGHRDTNCGPLSDLKIDWSWMRQGNGHNKHRVKEMTETFQENMQEIKLHELHVKEKEKILRKIQKHTQDDTQDLSILTPKQVLWDKLKALEKAKDIKNRKLASENIHMEPAKSLEMAHDELLQSLHFNTEEASALLKSASNDQEERTTPPGEQKQQKGKLVKNFGFFPVEDDQPKPDDSYDDDDDDNDEGDEDDSEEEDDVEGDEIDDDADEDEDEQEGKLDPEVSEKEMDFTTTERIVLDYQAGVLYLALASILMFFIVAFCYSLKHLRTWSNYNYKEDIEELKNWIWAQSHKQDGKSPLPSTIYKTTTEVVSKEYNGNCKYLERIISKNAKRKMNRVPQNVYEQGARSGIETRPLTASCDDLEVHKPTSTVPPSSQY